jgi:hypothetical protein
LGKLQGLNTKWFKNACRTERNVVGLFQNSMAKIAAESITEEELEAKRSSRARAMAKWKKEDPTQRFTAMIGETLTVATEAVDEVLRGLEKVTIKDEEKARVEVLRGALRKAHNDTSAKFTRTEIGNRLGLQALDKIFDASESLEGLLEEEKKLMQAYVKEQQDGGGKWKKKSGAAVAEAATAASNSFYTGFPGWNYYQQPMAPNLQQQYSAMWQQPGPAAAYPAGGYAGLQGIGGQGNMREDKKARFPCDNCGQLGHWRYQPMCPNYSKHLEAMQQVAAAYRAGQGGQGAAAAQGGAALSVVPYTGTIFQDKLAMVQAF